VFVGDNKKFKKRKRPGVYDSEVVNWLKKIWGLLDYPCRKRLSPFMKEVLNILEKNGVR